MPSRWLRLPIVVFWLATTVWLFWHDLWPNWRSGEPPPFVIDPVEEVHKDGPLQTFWTVQRRRQGQTQRIFRAKTWVDYQPDEDTFTLHARLDAASDPTTQPVFTAKYFKIDALSSAYRVNRLGQLRSLEANVTTTSDFNQGDSGLVSMLRKFIGTPPGPPPKGPPIAGQLSLRIWGEVRGDHFFAHCRADSVSLLEPLQFDLPVTTVSHTGSVLMPLHPLNHIRGLRRGQSWRQPLVDPLGDAFASLPGLSGGARTLNARVLPQPEVLTIDNNEMNCLVIEYTNDENEMVGRTWVEQESERVQQQEANLGDGRWIMRRDLLPRIFRSPPKR